MSFVNASPVPNPSGSVTPVAVPPSSWSRKVMAMSSAQSRLTLTALGIGVGLGGFFALLLMCIFIVFYRRRKFNKKKRVDELLCEHDYLDNHPQLREENVSPLFDIVSDSSKRVVSPHVATKPQLPLVQASYVIPFSTSDGGSSEKPVSGESTSYSYRTFSYVELARATDNFSSVNLLGQGGFGYVHKGVLLDGTEVAVKQLKTGSGQGEREFQAEVDTISRVQLKHLVSLVGYCISDDQRLLVYEFVPNKTLEFHLHAVGEGRTPLSWSTRLKIALGSARGLTYLHEDCHPKIIHRDIKASNILLDDDFEAKVADFGLAKFSYDNDTHVSTRVMGTFGYLAPEYASSGKLTEKSDVFSFGVVLLELITGRRPIDKGHCFMDDSMVEWARPLLREALETGNFDGLVDPKLDQYNSAEMGLMVACAAASVQQSAKRRPRMSQIVQALEGNLSIDNLCNELSPASSGKWGGSSEYEQYKENMKKFRKLALESQDVSTCTGITATASISSNPNESQSTRSGNSKKDNDEDVHEIPIL